MHTSEDESVQQKGMVRVLDTLDALTCKLRDFVSGNPFVEDCYQGQSQKSSINVFAGDEDIKAVMSHWMAKGKFSKLAELWANGATVDWRQFYKNKTQPSHRKFQEA